VTVVCATRGEAGEALELSPNTDLGTVREGELRRAAVHLGVARVEVLGYRDSGFDGDLVLDGSDGHRDHQHVRAASVRRWLRDPAPPCTSTACPTASCAAGSTR
jgi:LmbE family N-acetylglucosaminyl deacetylase